jgi:hypothetical protein
MILLGGRGKLDFAAALKGRDFQSRRKKPNNIDSGFRRRIEYFACERFSRTC